MRFLLKVFLLLVSIDAQAQNSSRGVEAENNAPQEKGQTHVVLIGVSKYAFLSKEKELIYAHADAQLLKEYFTAVGITDVKIFLNEEAAKVTEIGQEIENTLLLDAKAGDEVFLFFAGHGDVDPLYKDGYLLLNEVKPAATGTYKFNQALSLKGLQETIAISEEKGVKVKLIVDACHSGSALTTNPHNVVSNFNSGLVKMVSCTSKEFSEEGPQYGNGHGVFTYYLVQGLMGLANINDDNEISIIELRNYVETQVAKATQKRQHPQFLMDEQEEVIAFVKKDLLKEAKKNENLDLALTTLTKNKALESGSVKMSNYCMALTQLFLEQTIAGKFYVSELDSLDKQTLALGTVIGKKVHEGNVSSVSTSPDGKYYASIGEEGVFIYSNGNLTKPKTIEGLNGAPNSLAFDEYGLLLYAGLKNASVVQYDFRDNQVLTTIPVKEGVRSVEVYKDSLLLVGTSKGSIYVHDLKLKSGKTIKAHKGNVIDLQVNFPYAYSIGRDGKLIKTNLLTMKKELAVATGAEGGNLDILLLKDKQEILTLGADGVLYKWGMKSLEGKSKVNLGMKSVNCMVADPFEKLCFVGGSEKKLFAVELFNMSVLKPKTAGTSGVVSLDYDPKNSTLLIGEKDGSVTLQKLKVNPDLPAALELYRQLRLCDASPEMDKKLKGTLIVGLTNKVNEVLEVLVNGGNNLPTVSQIEQVIKYARKASELAQDQAKLNERLEINVLLLEVYRVLFAGDRSQYSAALKKIERIMELDPEGAYVYNTAALLHLEFQELDKALKMIEKAESLADVWIEPTYNFGKILMEKGDINKAELKFKQTIEAVPDLAKAYTALMDVYLIQKNYKEAMIYAQRAKLYDTTRIIPDDLKKYAKLESDRYRSGLSSELDTIQVGDIMGGGIVAFIEPETNKGIIVFPYDLDEIMSWDEAKRACEDMNVNGYSDWHLPTLSEFTNIAISYLSVPGFKAHFDESYWTDTTDKDGKNAFWVGNRGTAIDKALKSNLRYVRPVRYF